MQYTENFLFLFVKMKNFTGKKLIFFFLAEAVLTSNHNLCFGAKIRNQGTNGPVNAHLRSAVYMNVIENSPSIGADEALGPFFSSE